MSSSANPTAGAKDVNPPVDNELTRYVSIETLHLLQDRFAALAQVTVVICTNDGTRLTAPTWGSRYSALIGDSPLGCQAFADSLRTLAASPTSEAPSICHEGLTLYASRIMADGAALGVIAVGTRPAHPPSDDELRVIAKRYAIDPDGLVSVIDRTTPHTGATPEATHRFADTLAETIATLYRQASRIHQQLEDLTTVLQLSDLLAGTQDLQEIFDRTVKRVVEVMPVKACGIRLLNEETGELVVKAVANLSEEYLEKGRITLTENPIDSAAFAGKTVYIADAPTDPRIRYPDNARREGIVSGLCVPMTYRGRTVGVLRVYTSKPHQFTDSESALLRSIGSQAASAIVNTTLFEERASAERVRRQLESAAQIQRRMLPTQPPKIAGLDFGYAYVPSLQLGGDSYDFIELPDGSLGCCVADVVGKGLPAALMMASVRAALRSSAYGDPRPDVTMAHTNRHMCRETIPSEFATLMYGVFAGDGSTLTYCNAGHPPPLLLRGDDVLKLSSGGMVIGVDPQATYEKEVVALQSGDVLVVYSDGVTEARDYHDEEYGHERLEASMRRHRALSARHLCRQILWDVRRFVGLCEQSDDITIVVAKAT